MASGSIYILGEIGEDTTAETVRQQLRDQAFASDYKVYIDSIGGSFQEGFAIHDLLMSTGKPLTTVNIGKVYSIATVPYLAAKPSKRLSRPNAEFLFHNPWTEAGSADGETLMRKGADLLKAERKLEKFYSQHTGKAQKFLSDHMKQDKTVGVKEAMDMGFCGGITESQEIGIAASLKPVEGGAVVYIKSKIKSKLTMANKVIDIYASITKGMDKLLAFGEDETKNMDLPLADGSVLFVDSETEDLIGKPAMVDGEVAEDGTYELADGRMVSVAGGVVTEVSEAAAEGDKEDDEMASLKAENEALKAKLAEAEATNTKAVEAAEAMQAKFAEVEAKYQTLASAAAPSDSDTATETKIAAKARRVGGADFAAAKGVNLDALRSAYKTRYSK